MHGRTWLGALESTALGSRQGGLESGTAMAASELGVL